VDLTEAAMKLMGGAILCCLFACAQPERRSAPEETREAVGMSTDAGARAANEPGGSSLRTTDAGTDLMGPDAGDGGQERR
jgi:hypothetical protein